MKKILFLLSCSLFCLFICCLSLYFLNHLYSRTENTEDVGITPTVINLPANNTELSIYNDELEFIEAERIYISELHLLNDVVDIIKTKNWDFRINPDLPLSKIDLESLNIDEYIIKDELRSSKLTIPSELEAFYLDQNDIDYIENLIFQARKEFIDELGLNNVSDKYIDEIINNTFPEDRTRLTYHPENDPDSPSSSTSAVIDESGSKSDYSKLRMDIYPVDIYNNTDNFINSGIYKSNSVEELNDVEYGFLRDMGLRYLIYHEMTHVLQKAVDTVNSTDDNKFAKSSWISASKSLYRITDRYNIEWGNDFTLNQINNRTINNESQADGIALYMIKRIYSLSEIQNNLMWEFLINRLDEGKYLLESSLEYLNEYQEGYDVTLINRGIYNAFKKYFVSGSSKITIINKLTSRLIDLASYYGYFHPVLNEDINEVFQYLTD